MLGKGTYFLLLESNEKDAIHNAIMLSPHKSKWGTCMLQSWVPGFNPYNHSMLTFPTWVTLRSLSYKHHDHAYAIVETLGVIIGMIRQMRRPKFLDSALISK